MARPYKYSVEELENKIDDYFEDRTDPEKKINFVSITDLCYFLDVDRSTFYRWKNKSGYATIVKKAEQAIISVWEQQLMLPGRNTTGAIFWLKNFAGMSDKVEHQHSGQVEHNHRPQLDNISQDKLEKLNAALEEIEEDNNVIDVTPEEEAEE